MLYVYDNIGRLILGPDNRVFNIIDFVPTTRINNQTVNGSKYVQFSAWPGTPQIVVMNIDGPYYGLEPNVVISGDGVYWYYNSQNHPDNISVRILCGVW